MKLSNINPIHRPCKVAPRTGAWIETFNWRGRGVVVARRPPHGGVD